MFKIRPGCNTVTKTIRIPDTLVQDLEQAARENNVTFTSVVIQCLEYALENMENNGENLEKGMPVK